MRRCLLDKTGQKDGEVVVDVVQRASLVRRCSRESNDDCQRKRPLATATSSTLTPRSCTLPYGERRPLRTALLDAIQEEQQAAALTGLRKGVKLGLASSDEIQIPTERTALQ